MAQLSPIGRVINTASSTDKPGQIKQLITQIEIAECYAQGLISITEHQYITVVFGLHLNHEVHLTEKRKPSGEWGIFACRSQFRPNHLGVTTCKLLGCEGRILTVQGLDACNDTPVYDLKCPDTSEHELRRMHDEILQKNPRHDIDYDLRNEAFYPLVLKAAQLTGTIDNELQLGVLAGMHLVSMFKKRFGSYHGSEVLLTAHCTDAMLKGVLFAAGATLKAYQNTFAHRPELLFETPHGSYRYQLHGDVPHDLIKEMNPEVDKNWMIS